MPTTKQRLAEQILYLLKNGYPKASSTIKLIDIKNNVEQVLNQMFKAEQFSVNMPNGETIPDGLSLLTYDSVPVTRYKNCLSRAQLPAMPIMLPRNMGVFHVSPAVQELDTTLDIAATDANKPESITGTTPFTFTITRTVDLSGIVNVFYVVEGYGSNPAQPSDFGGNFPYGVVTFNSGDSTKTITINVVGAGLVAEKQFAVTISNPTPATTILNTPTAIGTIQQSIGARVTQNGLYRITENSKTRILEQ